MPESFQGSGNPAADAHDGSAEDAPRGADPLVGTTVSGRYKVTSVIARGGMGKVYRAEQAPLGRICALKVLSPKYEGDKDPEFHKRFFLEAATAAKISHPNTVMIFDYGNDNDIYYIAMEYVEGRTLFRVLRDEGVFSEARTAHVTRQICRALRAAHELGVIHRDLKPGNVMLLSRGDERDQVKVLDFGLVKDVTGEKEDLTQQGLFMGSPKYMAPEQILGGECSPRTDVYALGVMMYEMLCGRVPFDRGAGVGTLMAHVHQAPPAMQTYYPGIALSPGMEAIVFRCLEKDPANRFGSMNELLTALKHLAGEDSLIEGHDSMAGSVLTPSPRSLVRGSNRPSMPEHTPGPRGPLSSRDMGSGPGIRPSSSYPGVPVSSSGVDSRSFQPPSITDISPAPAPIPDTGVVEQPQRKRVLPYVIGGLAVVVAGVVVITSRSGGPSGATPDTSTPSAQVTASAAPTVAQTVSATAATVAAPAPRNVKIDSTPSGAAVLENGKAICGATPCTVTWTGAEAQSEHQLTITKTGYKSSNVKVSASDESASAKLAPLPAVQAPAGGYKKNPFD